MKPPRRSARAGEIGGAGLQRHSAASRCGCLPAARTGALWVKRCTSTQRRLPTRWIAVFPPVAKCSRRHCAKRCLTRFGATGQYGRAQPAIVAFEIAMAAHWRAEGLKPDFAIGHSVGEFAAAVVCGHYTIEQVMPLVCRRGALCSSAQARDGGGICRRRHADAAGSPV